MVQWLRIHVAMQGTQFWSLVLGISHTPWVAKIVCCEYRSPHAPPHRKQHFQVTSLGLPQTTGAPLGFLFPSLQTLFLKKKKISRTLLDKCHSGRKKAFNIRNSI